MDSFYALSNMIETLVRSSAKCIANKREHGYHQINEQKLGFDMKIWVSRPIISIEAREGKSNT